MLQQIYEFQLDGNPVYCSRYGNGHINETYLIVDSTARQFIFQKINKHVFKNPEALMMNLSSVLHYLKGLNLRHREILTLIPTREGTDWHVDKEGQYWRMYEFISDSICFEKAECADDFRKSGIAFGRFQQQLADFPVKDLKETIPLFHNTPNYYKMLKEAIAKDPMERAGHVEREIEFALQREEYAALLIRLRDKGDLPVRVTHNDTKLNNVLFDRLTREPLCVIDLDTVMPGLIMNDYGDSIRFGASTAAEDEADLSKVSFSPELFEAYTSGFLSVCRDSLNECELEHLCDGAKMMTLECGVRFLTDYLSGDQYFHTKHEEHNRDRCRTQFKLVKQMEQQWDEMRKTVARVGRI